MLGVVRRGVDAASTSPVRALLDAGADKNLADNDGDTPLFTAAQNGHDAVVRTLLDAGADKDLVLLLTERHREVV